MAEVFMKYNEKKITKKNIPESTEVNRDMFLGFLDELKDLNVPYFVKEDSTRPHSDSCFIYKLYKDEFGNLLAMKTTYFDGSCGIVTYRINRELLQLSISRRELINDEFIMVETTKNLGECMPCSIEKTVDISAIRCGGY